MTTNLNTRQAALLDIIAAHPGLTAAQLGLHTSPPSQGRSTSQIARVLVNAGLVDLNGGTYAVAAPAAPADSARPAAVLTTAGQNTVAFCTIAQADGKALEMTPSGKVAKMVRVTLDVRHSTDGKWIVAKNGTDATAECPWALYQVAADGALTLQGTYSTCTAAFSADVVA